MARYPGLGPEVLELGQIDVCFLFLYTGLDGRLLEFSPGGEEGGGVWFVICYCLLVVCGGRSKHVMQGYGRQKDSKQAVLRQ